MQNGDLLRTSQKTEVSTLNTDEHLTRSAIKKDNPIGHRIFTDYISKVISKPSKVRLQSYLEIEIVDSGYQPVHLLLSQASIRKTGSMAPL